MQRHFVFPFVVVRVSAFNFQRGARLPAMSQHGAVNRQADPATFKADKPIRAVFAGLEAYSEAEMIYIKVLRDLDTVPWKDWHGTLHSGSEMEGFSGCLTRHALSLSLQR